MSLRKVVAFSVVPNGPEFLSGRYIFPNQKGLGLLGFRVFRVQGLGGIPSRETRLSTT